MKYYRLFRLKLHKRLVRIHRKRLQKQTLISFSRLDRWHRGRDLY
jgi:hypothetical protein